MPANAKLLAVGGAVTLILAVVAGVRLSRSADDGAGISIDPTVVEPPRSGALTLHTSPRTHLQTQSTVSVRERHGRQVPAGASSGFVRLRVLDAKTGERIHGFKVRVYGPGVAIVERKAEGFLTEVPLRLGMPANLEIEAPGYLRADVRQVHLTEETRSRQIEVRMTAR